MSVFKSFCKNNRWNAFGLATNLDNTQMQKARRVLKHIVPNLVFMAYLVLLTKQV